MDAIERVIERKEGTLTKAIDEYTTARYIKTAVVTAMLPVW